ncbi:MAPK/ERK kinase kinase 1 [Artemisia annua]|uniref:mitogen-activated protein kinase kinase kinase n=1 Tax=Artemisia annua TaxID=35608 RepID=A0A2U1M4J4_ARTAN|nr:MAPK/ERK kinase kinase 1 [Artemisia annua]
MSRVIVDDSASNWDLIRSFAPMDNEDLASERRDEGTSSSNEGVIVETSEMITSRSDAMGDEEEEASSSVITAELQYTISPNGTFRGSFKNWQKGDFLGSGSFGTVYEGFDESGFFFAVKEVSLLDQGSQGKQSIVQLEQEISLLSQFHHENIVRYLGTDSDDGKLYIFLELVTKGSLAKLYQKYDLRDSQVSAYTRQILSGLNYLHERKVVHRDIKCANILVDASGSVKLADFGLAKATTLNDIKSCKGTPYWMAPEVVNNRAKKGYGLAADIWSLGCTVLEMLTRKIPYYHLEGMQALFRIGRGEPPEIPNTLSAEAQDFILKCLQVNPNDRPTAAQLLEHPFLKRPASMNSAALPSPHHNSPQL